MRKTKRKAQSIEPTFTVWLYYAEGTPELVINKATAKEASEAAITAVHSGGARCGMTRRVTVLDDREVMCFEWLYGAGVVFPAGIERLAE